jgi:type II secretory pathway component PulJ
MMVSGVIATLVATVTIQALRIQRDTLTREQDLASATLALETMSRDIRQALAPQLDDGTNVPAFSAAGPGGLTVISWIAADPVQITYALSDGTLTRTVRQPDAVGKGTGSVFTGRGVSSSAVLARSVTSATLFTYVLTTGDRAASYTATPDLAAIRSVAISLTVDSDGSGRLAGTHLDNSVVCLNL